MWIYLHYWTVHLKHVKIITFMFYVFYYNLKKQSCLTYKYTEFTYVNTQFYSIYDPGWKDPGFGIWYRGKEEEGVLVSVYDTKARKRKRVHLSRSMCHLWVPLDATQSSKSFMAAVLQFSRLWVQANSSKTDRSSRADGVPSSVQVCCWIWLRSNLNTLV